MDRILGIRFLTKAQLIHNVWQMTCALDALESLQNSAVESIGKGIRYRLTDLVEQLRGEQVRRKHIQGVSRCNYRSKLTPKIECWKATGSGIDTCTRHANPMFDHFRVQKGD
jgi:hypothetical protein